MYQISLFFVTRHWTTFQLKNNHKTSSCTNTTNSLPFCIYKIIWDWIWKYPNLQLHKSVSDLYFGLYFPLVYVSFLFNCFICAYGISFYFLILYICTVTISHLPVTLRGASLLTSWKARSQTTHSSCLGTQWPDARHTSDNTDSKNEQKLLEELIVSS